MRTAALIVFILAVIVAPFAHAQLAQNGTTTSAFTFTTGTLSTTFNHTTPSMANRLMAVAVHLNTTNSTGTTVASVTYAGQALTVGNARTRRRTPPSRESQRPQAGRASRPRSAAPVRSPAARRRRWRPAPHFRSISRSM